MDVPEPLFTFPLFPELVAACPAEEGASNAALEALIQQLPPIHVASLKVRITVRG